MLDVTLSIPEVPFIMGSMKTLGQVLKQTREARGLAAADVAAATGHGPSWLSDWELDKKAGPMAPYEMNALSRTLGIPMSELLTASGYEGLGEDPAALPRRAYDREVRVLLATVPEERLGRVLDVLRAVVAMNQPPDAT